MPGGGAVEVVAGAGEVVGPQPDHPAFGAHPGRVVGRADRLGERDRLVYRGDRRGVVTTEAEAGAQVADRAGQAPAVADRREPVPGGGEVRGSTLGIAAYLGGEPPVQVAVGSQPRVAMLDQVAELGRTLLLLAQQREDERHGWMRSVVGQLGGAGRGTLPALEVLDREVMHRIVAERGGQRGARHAPGVVGGG